jgi:GDP-4-dehydro-6-deoxy-D-mannose reductase
VTSTNAEPKRALITGVTGFAGRHLAAQLRGEGWNVAGVARSGPAPEGVAVERIDIGDSAAVQSVVQRAQPDTIFHLAAIVDTVSTPSVEELMRVNVGGTQAVADAALELASPTRIVFASSAFVYGSTTPEEQPLTEQHPLRPLTPYGESKVAAEEILQSHAAAGGDAVIARAFQHTGPGHVGAYALPDWAERLARLELAGGAGTIATGNLDVERDYLDVRDVASAYRALGERGASGAIYNVASGSPVAMRRLLEGLIDAFGVDAAQEVDPQRVRAVDQPVVVGDSSKLTNDTGWQPAFALEQTLADLAAFWRARVREN